MSRDMKLEGLDPSIDLKTNVDPNAEYELSSLLGEGSYGAVYRGRSRITDRSEEVAIKIIPDADDDLTALWREIRFLQVLRSPFVVSFIESLLYDNELWLVMELCDGGSLYDLKEANNAAFTEQQLQGIIAFCALGLAHLHAQMSIHRDVKAGNILLTRDGRAKLADFGVSAQLTDTIMKRRTVIGSPYWMAPEVIQEASYDGKADIWSLGITLLEICEGAPPLFHVHPMRAIFMISSRAAPVFKEPNRWSQDMKDFLSHCLIKDFDKRYSAAELLKHNWIRKTVIKIGANGTGLPELEELMADNWDALERIRIARCKVPDNIMLPEVEQLAEDAGIAVINSEPNTPTIRRAAAAAMSTTTSSSTAGVLTEVSIESDLSINSSLSMVRKHSYGIGGIAATRQQLRNASLHRPLFPNNNLFNNTLNLNSSMLNQSMIRNNPTLEPSSADAYEGGTFVVRPLHGAPIQNDWQQTSSSMIRVDPNAQTKDGTETDNYHHSNNNPPYRQSTFLTSIDRYYDSSSMVKVTANSLHGSPSSSFVQRPQDTPSPSSRLDNKNNIQAALRYFRNDPMTPPTINPAPIAEEKTASPYQNNNSLKASGIDSKEVTSGGSEKLGVSPKTDSANKPPTPFANRKLPPVPIPPPPLPSTAQAEAALLDDFANNSSDLPAASRRDYLDEDRRDFMKKEIMMQLVVLKKQYREDVEIITKTYELRKKAMKDALLQLSNTSNGSIPNGRDKSAK